jgi:simple sugar transport system substrate-binding protein
MLRLGKLLTGVLMSGAVALSVASAAYSADSDHKDEWAKFKIQFLVWTAEGVPFFAPAIAGAQDAAAQQGVNIDIQYGGSNTANQNTIHETAIANGVNGILTTIWDDEAFDDVLCKAMKQGIAVMAYNIDDSKGAAGTCRMAYMGQNFVETGYAIGKRMIETHGLKKGDLVFTPVEFPNAVYAQLRHAGVKKAMDEIGATTEILGTDTDSANALNLMTQYLVGHPETKAVIGLGLTPTSVAVRAIQEAGLNIPAGGFDVSPEVIQDIKDGKLTATVDQQPYSQGFYAVTQMALYLKYGLYPSDMATGGAGLIDKTNTEKAERWAGKTR